MADYPAVSTSIGGGRLHAATIGVNYTLNQYGEGDGRVPV